MDKLCIYVTMVMNMKNKPEPIHFINSIFHSLNWNKYSIKQLLELCAYARINENTLRSILNRGVKQGIYTSYKEGRKVYYCLSKSSQKVHKETNLTLCKKNNSKWDGDFKGVVFSISEENKEYRHVFRKLLKRSKFGPLYPGFWIRPKLDNEDHSTLENKLRHENIGYLLTFSSMPKINMEIANQIWKIDEYNKKCNQFIQEIHAIGNRTAIDREEAFYYRTQYGRTGIKLITSNPELPPELLPSNWYGEQMIDEFFEWEKALLNVALPFIQSVKNKV